MTWVICLRTSVNMIKYKVVAFIHCPDVQLWLQQRPQGNVPEWRQVFTPSWAGNSCFCCSLRYEPVAALKPRFFSPPFCLLSDRKFLSFYSCWVWPSGVLQLVSVWCFVASSNHYWYISIAVPVSWYSCIHHFVRSVTEQISTSTFYLLPKFLLEHHL